jgi:TPR repeat protein
MNSKDVRKSRNSHNSWFCSIEGEEQGPLTTKEMKALVASGKLLEHHLIWKDGGTKKVPANKVRGLFPAASSTSQSSANNEDSTDSNICDVFLSYSGNDKLTADAICATLERNKIRCWIAPRDVMPGMNYGEAIIDAINESRMMIIVFSSASDGSPQVLREVERAVSKGIPIVPFRIEEIEPSKSMEYFLSTPHWLDALTKPLEKHIERLLGTVQSVLDPSRKNKSSDSVNQISQKNGNEISTKSGSAMIPMAFVRNSRIFIAVKKSVDKIPRKTRYFMMGTALLVMMCLILFPSVIPSSLESEYKEYRHAVVTGQGSVSYLKDTAPHRFATWLELAENGDPISQLFIARCYQDGLVVVEDDAVAISWLQKSAAQGNDYAIHSLAYAYKYGEGVDKDEAEALRWYSKSVDLGNTTSMRNLADMYRKGINGGKPDFQKALKLYKQGASAGDPAAMRSMGKCYQFAWGVSKDLKEAQRWYEKAAINGDLYTQGELLAKKMVPMVEEYTKSDATNSSQTTSLDKFKSSLAEFKKMKLTAVVGFFDSTSYYTFSQPIKKLKKEDSLSVQFNELIKHFIPLYGNATISSREWCLNTFSSVTVSQLEQWHEKENYDKITTFYQENYMGLDLNKLNDCKESLVRSLKICIPTLLRTGNRKEASELLKSTIDLCERTLVGRPWEWYVKEGYLGLCFDTANTYHELGEFKKVQPLLQNAWNITFKRHGKDNLISRYKTLPLKGEVPAGASESDKKYFLMFKKESKKGSKKDPKKKKKSLMKKFTIPCDFGGKKAPFDVYVIRGTHGYAELQDQFRWLKERRGGDVPQDVRTSFRKLNALAVKNDVDFMELSVYALDAANKDKKKK